MTKCYVCVNHITTGRRHLCTHCSTKVMFGDISEPFIEACKHFKKISGIDGLERMNEKYEQAIYSADKAICDGKCKKWQNGGCQIFKDYSRPLAPELCVLCEAPA